MDWTLAIDRNTEALKRVLVTLVAMAGFADGPAMLPRRLRSAVLRLLRPAESATRRLIIAMARNLVFVLPQPRKTPRRVKRKRQSAITRDPRGTGIYVPRWAEIPSALMHLIPVKPPVVSIAFPLTDPLRRLGPPRPRSVPSWRAPRVLSLDSATPPAPVRGPPKPDDIVDATRLALRLKALAAALDDLPRQAKRFARWKARQAAGLIRRSWPLRTGPAYGIRRPGSPRKPHEVDEIARETHWLAYEAKRPPDTS